MFSAQQQLDRIRKIAKRPRRCFRPVVMAVLLIAITSNPSAAADGNAALVVSLVSAAPSGEDHDGKSVWVDLITTEPKHDGHGGFNF